MNYFITRHKGALLWLQRMVGAEATHLRHLHDLQMLRAGDTVYGNLPVNLVADICARGAHYFHLQIEVPEPLRGEELTAEQLANFGAKLVEYIALRPISDESILQQAEERELFL